MKGRNTPSEALNVPSKRFLRATRVWSLSPRHLFALPPGIILFALSSHVLIFAFSGYIEPAAMIALFFGAMYGPWVGLLVGGGGAWLENQISLSFHAALWVPWSPFQSVEYPSLVWGRVLGFALMGGIAGLALYWTQGRYRTEKELIIGWMVGAIADSMGVAIYEGIAHTPFVLILKEVFLMVLVPCTWYVLLLAFFAFLKGKRDRRRQREEGETGSGTVQ